MRTLFLLGSPYWCRYLETALIQEGVDARYVPHRSMLRIFSDRDAMLLAVGYGTQLSLKRSAIWLLIFAWWLLSRRRGSIVLYWIGTDVFLAGNGSKNRLLPRLQAKMGVRHFCGAPWFVETLHASGIVAQPVLFPYDTSAAEDFATRPIDPQPIRILTYLVPGAWENMNGSMILELARQTPEFEWNVVGMKSSQIAEGSPPSNMHFHGWVANPLSVLATNHIFIRIIGHDAYSGMIRDAQAMGKIVLYSKPIDGVIDISGKGVDQITVILKTLEVNKRRDTPVAGESHLKASKILPPFRQQISTLINAIFSGR